MSSRLHRLIEWPLWSWRHLAITVVVLLAALALVGKVTNALSAKAGPASAEAAATTPAPPSMSSTQAPSVTVPAIPAPEASRPSTSDAPAAAQCQDVAASFMNAWVRTSLPPASWLSGMRPYVSPELMAQLGRTDPARVPASRVSGQPVAVPTGSGAQTLRFATDGGRVDVVTHKAGSSCVVSDIEPAGDVQGAPTPSLTPSAARG